MNSIKETIADFIIDIVETVVIALSIFAVVYLLAFQPHEVIGKSMDGLDNFHNGQYILTDKLTYRFREPQRGEVIIFKYPLDKNYDYIKRIIGLPGEEIQLRNNKIYIYNDENPDGLPLNENGYIASNIPTSGRAFLSDEQRITIPKDSYFVLGDNRTQSSDSRTWGFISRNDIVGRSLFRYWPPNEIGMVEKAEY